MTLIVEFIYGVGVGLEVVPEENAWILDLFLIRFVYFPDGL